MKHNMLGKTGIKVSELCYGALPIGPLQSNYAIDKAADVIRYSLDQGVTFVDTAQRYQTYPHIRKALEGFNGQVIIASKSGASSYKEMSEAIEEAREGLGRDMIDIFHLHAPRGNAEIFEERKGALECLCDAKAKGIIRAVGISTHSVKAVQAATEVKEIDIIFPLINLLGIGIIDGTLSEMFSAIRAAGEKGKGLYLMKVMAGGHLVDRFEEAIDYARTVPGTASFAIGMLSRDEVDLNLSYLEGKPISKEQRAKAGKTGKKLYINDLCKGCGECVKHCASGALSLINGKACVDPELCVLCGYCVPHCPQFALRLITPAN